MKLKPMLIIAISMLLGLANHGFAFDDGVSFDCSSACVNDPESCPLATVGYPHASGFAQELGGGVCWRVDMVCSSRQEIEVGSATFTNAGIIEFEPYYAILGYSFKTAGHPPDSSGVAECDGSRTIKNSTNFSEECKFADGTFFSIKARVVESRLCDD